MGGWCRHWGWEGGRALIRARLREDGVDIGGGREGRALIRARLREDGIDIGGGRKEGSNKS